MPSHSTLRITDAQKTKYQTEGFFILEKIIPDEDLKFLRSECDDHVQQQNTEMDRLGTDVLNLSRRNSRYFVFLAYKERPQLGEFIFSDRMRELCRATIGDTAYLFWEQFVVKGTDKKGAEFGWHQDSGYVDHVDKPYVNFWIPLDDVNEENGTVSLLSYTKAGTREKVEHKPVPGTNDRVGYFGSDPGVPAICPAGSIVVFSSTVFHRSGANYTNKMRRAYAVQFSPEVIYEADGSLKGLDVAFLKNGRRVK
jgi:ectoine hydroxylase-related dioxygenase (phytanoyl-CoA dioxygenase family)